MTTRYIADFRERKITQNEIDKTIKEWNDMKHHYEMNVSSSDELELCKMLNKVAIPKKVLADFIEDGLRAYPEDIFPPITTKQMIKINHLLQSEMGFPVDRLLAHMNRNLIKAYKQGLLAEGDKE